MEERSGEGAGERFCVLLSCSHVFHAACLEAFEEFAEESTAQLQVETPLPTIKADPARVLTVFQNLIANGLKYNNASQKLIGIGFDKEVGIGDRKLTDVFYVRDNGIGISPKFHVKIFEIFTRLNTEKEFGPGTGAGLAFVKRIIEERGGEFALQSTPGDGSTFYFSFPLPDPPADGEADNPGD